MDSDALDASEAEGAPKLSPSSVPVPQEAAFFAQCRQEFQRWNLRILPTALVLLASIHMILTMYKIFWSYVKNEGDAGQGRAPRQNRVPQIGSRTAGSRRTTCAEG